MIIHQGEYEWPFRGITEYPKLATIRASDQHVCGICRQPMVAWVPESPYAYRSGIGFERAWMVNDRSGQGLFVRGLAAGPLIIRLEFWAHVTCWNAEPVNDLCVHPHQLATATAWLQQYQESQYRPAIETVEQRTALTAVADFLTHIVEAA